MAVTTMEKITYLAKKLQNNADTIPHLKSLILKKDELFSWNHHAYAITYNPSSENAAEYLLHEYSHALLQHQNYEHDIDLIKLERAAWDKALEIAPQYAIDIDESLIETSLDSYRDWLHSRSLCPHCHSTGLQASHQDYYCPACTTTWHVNEAKTCALRRYIKKRS